METSSDVKCIFNSAYEKQIAAAVENYRQVQNELSKAEIKVQDDVRGRPKIIVNDFESGKKFTVNFCSKSKLERILRERLGFNNVKTIEAANALVQTLSAEQKKYFLSGSRQLEQMEFYQKDIKFENENVLADRFSFAKMKLPDEDFSRLIITDATPDVTYRIQVNPRKNAAVDNTHFLQEHIKNPDDTYELHQIIQT